MLRSTSLARPLGRLPIISLTRAASQAPIRQSRALSSIAPGLHLRSSPRSSLPLQARAFSLWPAKSPPPHELSAQMVAVRARQAEITAERNSLTAESAPSEPLPSTSDAASTSSPPDLSSASFDPSSSTPPVDVSAPIVERLSDYGLGAGSEFWFSGRFQDLIFSIHHALGTPWWATIAITAIGARLALWPVSISVQRHTSRIGRAQPTMRAFQAGVNEKRAQGRSSEMAELQFAARRFMSEYKVHPVRPLGLTLLQGPIMLGFFLAFKGMAEKGLPSMTGGGVGWFTDLTVGDPTFVMPGLLGASIFAMMKVTMAMQPENPDPQKAQMMRLLPYLLGPFSAFAMAFLPMAPIISAFGGTFLAAFQGVIMRLNPVRKALDIEDARAEPYPVPDELKPWLNVEQTGGPLGGFKSGVSLGQHVVQGGQQQPHQQQQQTQQQNQSQVVDYTRLYEQSTPDSVSSRPLQPPSWAPEPPTFENAMQESLSRGSLLEGEREPVPESQPKSEPIREAAQSASPATPMVSTPPAPPTVGAAAPVVSTPPAAPNTTARGRGKAKKGSEKGRKQGQQQQEKKKG